jgi:pyruvate formate lyase activating enzyme
MGCEMLPFVKDEQLISPVPREKGDWRFSECAGGHLLICEICPHRCSLPPGGRGRCRTRIHLAGAVELLTYGRVIASGLDPIEKKPLYHFRPGTRVYTIATPGCTLSCKFCQNAEIACDAKIELLDEDLSSPQDIVLEAIRLGADGVGFSYTEPGAALEFAFDVMDAAHRSGLYSIWHSNGFLTETAARMSAQKLDAACIDLKMPDEARCQAMTGGSLLPVQRTAKIFQDAGVWVEICTPILASVNDSNQDLESMASWILTVLGPETPWHLLRGHPSWELTEIGLTTTAGLRRAADIARQVGLSHVYPDTWLED